MPLPVILTEKLISKLQRFQFLDKNGEYESSVERNVGKLEKASLAKNHTFYIIKFSWFYFDFNYS